MYDLLNGIRVLEVAVLAPDRTGMHLADLGAEVVKVELPPVGDHIRLLGASFRGGPGLNHLRWNRGKKSVALNLKTEEGSAVFLELAGHAHVVIDGLRWGAMERFGLGYEAVKAVNPRIIYCSINGMGQTGPYRKLGSHGFGYDGFAGIAPVEFREDGMPYIGRHVGIGSAAGPLFAALAISAALVKAFRTNQGQRIDVAELDAAALWRSDELSQGLNRGAWRDRAMPDAVRYQYYKTKDEKYLMFQPFEWKFWEAFCKVIDRPDLLAISKPGDQLNSMDNASGNEDLRRELAALMQTKTQSEWVSFLIEHNIPGCPAYTTMVEMVEDPQFKARDNVKEVEYPDIGTYHMPTTPIKLPDQTYGVNQAPRPGQHTEEVLRGWLGYSEERIAELQGKIPTG